MLRNKILEKLLAIILIFTLTSANFAFVTKSYATSFAETFLGFGTDTGHKNVEFEAYFGTEEEQSDSVISDVNKEELSIGMKLDVKESGYLKDAKIEIAEAEEGKGLNFIVGNFESEVTEKENHSDESDEKEEVVEEDITSSETENEETPVEEKLEGNEENLEETSEEILTENGESEEEVNEETELEVEEEEVLPEYVQSLEDNIISLRQVNKSSEVKLTLPIKYKNETYVNENKFSNACTVIFSGIYVDDDGEEIEVSKEIDLNVSWKDQREVKLSSETTKYIDFGRGVILQTLVKVDTSTDKNTLPIKESEVVIDVPVFDEIKPSNVTVVANSTSGTNGQTVGNVDFNENNWIYNKEENKLTLKVVNEKKLVEVNEFEDEYLKEADKEVIEEERYYSESGVDEYLITYTFENAKINESITLNSNIEAKVTTFSGVFDEQNSNLITKNNNFEYVLEGQTGNIVSLNIENETQKVSKAYVYSNYNHNGKYEMEFASKTIANISYKEIIENIRIEDTENIYIDKAGNRLENNDLYYKQISVSKEEFTNILGETGEIKVLDISGEVISVINNETEVNEDGNIVLNFENKPARLVFEISKPVGEGNLVISNIKAMKDSQIDKPTFANLSEIRTKTAMTAAYTYVETRVDIGSMETVVNLIDTTTKANLVMDRDSLSTLADNDVELRIELNNAMDTSDLYGNSVFDIELPEYVQNVVVTNTSVLYGEGLDITNVEVLGRIIRVSIDGKQDGINSGVLTNGTNLVINANIKVDLYTPAKSDILKLRYTNNEATNYDNEGYTELPIMYSAPTGLVAVNSTSNYNNVGTITTSVRQGLKEDVIDIYAEAKTATMEIVVMNNNENTVSNVSILGRIPFKGVKDIATGEDLGTTLDTKFMSGIISDQRNRVGFDIYYSENGEASNDLNDSSNGWIMNPESLENMKSYLIVPQDENYEMNEAEILRFTYQYEIPANLNHNENIYGTFLAYYTNNSEVATTDENATPDKVGLTTGEGPELSIQIETDKETVQTGEELKIKVTVKNTGEDKAENIVITTPVPRFTVYKNSLFDKEGLKVEEREGNIVADLESLGKEESVEFSIIVTSTKLPSIVEYYKNTEGFMKREDGVYVIRKYSKTQEEIENSPDTGEEITYEDTEITSIPDVKLEIVSKVSAKDLNVELQSNKKEVNLKESEFSVSVYARDDAFISATQSIGTEFGFGVTITNISSKVQNNVIATKVLSNDVEFISAEIEGRENGTSYDESTRTITWKIDKLESKEYINLTYKIKPVSLPEGMIKAQIDNYVEVKADNTETYTSNNLPMDVGKPVITVTQTTSTTDTYVKEGQIISYIFNVKNEGSVKAKQVRFVDEIPEGLNVRSIGYTVQGIVNNKRISSNSEAIVDLALDPNTETVVTVKAVADILNGAQEKTVTNLATITAPNMEEQKTNTVTHIIETSGKSVVASQLQSSSTNSGTAQTNTNINKTFKLTGTAWVDSNKDGMRTTDEQLLPGIIVKLVNSETGVIQTSVTTDANGSYTFAGVTNGNYLVIFDYDTVKYTVTAYKKDGVDININSDAVTTKLEQDGKTRNGAITEVITISNGSVSGIDIGLVLADAFDLKLDKTITKVTTQSATGTKNDEYDNVSLAKTEIAAKHLYGSVVYVEYTITVSNLGDVAGYAKQIIDYLPEGMTFNSALEANSGWYTGSDGNLYSNELAERELAKGETASIKLVLTKQVTGENIGLTNNLAEIYEDYNIYGISDKNSTPANKAQGENDIGSADVIISAKTGESFIYVSVIITSILLGSIVIFIAYNKIIIKRRGGV